ncbi:MULTISPECIES: isocitrate lyase/phosphoenolpyruvate mutase family protein [unclassified Crossiella]|uniref:isocitrate lyase/PEP mutase family protein n=1 Tax=unclassified Crossiella TaxID=2620835 RepID=UPI001FFEBB62|nr:MULTISPECIES: isocitrate lyase/phosphoenolpyruvate mutase family protein [unclassified Crossiella]MCK2243977.1 isocitrate lyase/phosphoenolpyruvate mutase family protein [Crossiella sp. S99.2]MCK2257165.1 isocitrate lyase/phosphoenolpyruvate mutase family protein [Crossiella sp. S99.1]
MGDLTAQAAELKSRHIPGRPLVLPNAWDAATARLVHKLGFPVIATSSYAVAAAAGYPDDNSMPPEVAFAGLAAIAAATPAPVTADLEAGYGLSPAEFTTALHGAGAVGCNLEDGDHQGGLRPLAEQAAWLAEVKASTARPLVLNARIDCFILDAGAPQRDMAEAIARGRAYLAAGADCVYPIGLRDPVQIKEFTAAVGGPVNVHYYFDGPSVPELAALGVARISLGAGLFAVAQRAIKDAVTTLGDYSSTVD